MSKTKSKKRQKAAAEPASRADSIAGVRFRLKPWIPVAIVVALTAAVRIRLLGILLERDEGEYAYAGQLMLQGIPPYKLVYSMKFPGIDAAYAAIMAVFGQTIVGIHLGFLLVNAAAIVLMYLLGKRLFSPAAGVAACAAYALLSIGRGVLGTQAHATHFVVLAALGGTLLLLRGIETRRWTALFWSGVLYGVAVLMKQHGALFVAFGAAYLILDYLIRRRDAWLMGLRDLAIFLGGVSAPLALTGLALWWAGVFGKFWFWTFTYARVYAHEMQFSFGIRSMWLTFPDVIGPNLAIWIVALLGLVLIWWRKEDRTAAIFAACFLAFSFLAICPGFYFRLHYFVLMLPAVALLAGAAVAAAAKLWPRLSWLAYGVFAVALVISVVQQKRFLFQMSPIEISRVMYGASPFPEAIPIADYIRTHTEKDARIAILGSEPEIPFYAHRLSATGHIYMYGLMEPQPYALTMQDEFIREVEAAQPDYIVLATHQASWLQLKSISSLKILDWWADYQPHKYKKIVGVADIIADNHTEYRWADAASYQLQSPSAVVIYKRTDPADDPTALLNPADALEAQKSLELLAQENRQMFAFLLDPLNYAALNNLGMLLAKHGMAAEAMTEFRISLTVKPDQSEAHADKGWVFTQMHQFPEAAEEFTQALRFNPEAADSHNDLGAALFQMGDYAKAAEQFKEALRFEPAFTDAKENLGFAEAELKSAKTKSRSK